MSPLLGLIVVLLIYIMPVFVAFLLYKLSTKS